jgi:hypothetical protein
LLGDLNEFFIFHHIRSTELNYTNSRGKVTKKGKWAQEWKGNLTEDGAKETNLKTYGDLFP